MKSLSKTFASDYQNGKKAEALSHPILQQLTKNPLIHIQDPYSPWDFENQTTVIEHKSREVKFTDYNETMIEYLKVQRASNENKRVWFAFRFKDGLYVIRYKKELFDSFRRELVRVKDRIDYKDGVKEKLYIPTNLLKCLEKWSEPCLLLDD